MKTLLVPTDFSKYGNAGVKIASQIAEKTHSPIVLLHNVYSMVNWDDITESDRKEFPEIQSRTSVGETRLKDIIERDLGSDLDVRAVVTHGITHHEIVSKAMTLDAELIVMGSHGNEDQDRLFIGSNLQKVLRFATCPVLATKNGFNNDKVENIVFPFQFDLDVHKSFAEIVKIARTFGSKIHLLYVNTPFHFRDNPTIKLAMSDFCSHYPEQAFETAIYNQNDTVNGILEYCTEIKADMIAMVAHDRRRSSKYGVGITELVVCHAEIPVLSTK
jgi:nucleotide-binding universal stress UspA family protein